MIKIYIQNYFMENMFHKKNKTDNNKKMELHQQQKNKSYQIVYNNCEKNGYL